MAIAKVCGVETEYGILARGPLPESLSNPVAASSMLINAYLGEYQPTSSARRAGWDFHDEHPGVDARGFSVDDLLAPSVETTLVNAVLTNGARYYVDHAHPEISTPECRTALDAVRFDRAAEEIVRASMSAVGRLLPDGADIICHKNNSDGKGNSYGCHENYLVSRDTSFGRIVHQITPHFVTRQVAVGAGKVGCEMPRVPSAEVPFQLSQRADFFEEEVGLETTLKRPIVNTRDEPHCDPTKYRRLHVIVGDANMSEVATFVKVGSTAIVLAMIEDNFLGNDLCLEHPVAAISAVSHDPSLRATVQLVDGRRMTALEVQWSLYERARAFQRSRGLDAVDEVVGDAVLHEWGAMLAALDSNPDDAADVIDWVAKRRLVRAYAERHSLRPDDARLKAIDLQYHDLRPERCLAQRVGLRSLVNDSEVQAARTTPPDDTRAYFRGRCLSKWPTDVVAANWDSVVLDVGRDPLRRVPMMEPLRGTRDMVGALLDECDSTAELVRRLGA